MRYLLDVNILVAWGWEDHGAHTKVTEWLAAVLSAPDTLLLTSAIPQLGFVRVAIQRTGGAVTPVHAASILNSMLSGLADRHHFLPDDQASFTWPDWCQSAAKTTDAHLLALAQAHSAQLATLDKGIPGALVV